MKAEKVTTKRKVRNKMTAWQHREIKMQICKETIFLELCGTLNGLVVLSHTSYRCGRTALSKVRFLSVLGGKKYEYKKNLFL